MVLVKTFFDDDDQNLSGDGGPYLRLDCVRGSAKECLDTQVLFDPFEEQLDLPALLLKYAKKSTQIHQGVKFEGGFCRAKRRQKKQV